MSNQRHTWANMFELSNLGQLTTLYRLVRVEQLPDTEHIDQQLSQLATAVVYELKQPVAVVRRAGVPFLAIPASSARPRPEQQLSPRLVRLVPEAEEHRLDFSHLDEETLPIATRFLEYQLRAPLMKSPALWGRGSAFFYKQPSLERPEIDLYPGFVWSIVYSAGRLYLSVDLATRYVDHCWLTQRWQPGTPFPYGGRNCLYHYGDEWYVVQLEGYANASIADYRIMPPSDPGGIGLLAYINRRWQLGAPGHIRTLDGASPAMVYRKLGSRQEQAGAMALGKLIIPTSERAAASLHPYSAVAPTARLARTEAIVASHFQQACLSGVPIRVATTPRELPRRFFSIPAQRFGGGRILAVGEHPRATDHTTIRELGQARQRLLRDVTAGPLDTTSFGVQYLLLPRSANLEIARNFEARLMTAMRELSAQPDYTVERIVYDDREARTLYQQINAIKDAVRSNRISFGHALLVLPERAKDDLHDHIKKELWPGLQVQCAMLGKIASFYERGAGGGFQLAREKEGKLQSYIRNCAYGMMLVNRKWLWALADPLRYDVYIGIDVLHGMAGVTFVYCQGEQIFFHNYKSKQPERLTQAQLQSILLERLPEDLSRLGIKPNSIIVHRDGRTFKSELLGLQGAIREMERQGLLPADITVGVVDIRKSSTNHIRLFEGEGRAQLDSPAIGSYQVLNTREGVVCTTGWPFHFPGTASPLAVELREGSLNLAWVLEDIFALSQLIYLAPDKCARLPLTVKLADDFLEAVASAEDDDAARYETELTDEEMLAQTE